MEFFGKKVMNRPVCQRFLLLLCAMAAQSGIARSQTPTESLRIDLPEALARAKKYGMQLESANLALRQAAEDTKQAKAAALPQVSALNQFIYTEGNGTASGVFVPADGVHVYNEQLTGHQELLALLRRGEIRRAMTAEATARARIDVASRGLTATVVADYYAIVTAQRRLVNAQRSLQEAERFLDISQKQEKGGEVAHADVIKAQLQQKQRQRDVQDAIVAISKTKIALAVLIFPDLRDTYEVVDDLKDMPALQPIEEVGALAKSTSPDLRVAQSSLREAGYGVSIAKYAYLPSFALDVAYGISANEIAKSSFRDDMQRNNLGYQATATLNIPIWNWGAIRSRVKQASLRESQARLDLTLAERNLRANVATAHQEARAAQAQIASLQESYDLANESLRLTLLRYQAGEATALEVADAQTTAIQARNAYDDGMIRYRVAIANLQTLTGNL